MITGKNNVVIEMPRSSTPLHFDDFNFDTESMKLNNSIIINEFDQNNEQECDLSFNFELPLSNTDDRIEICNEKPDGNFFYDLIIERYYKIFLSNFSFFGNFSRSHQKFATNSCEVMKVQDKKDTVGKLINYFKPINFLNGFKQEQSYGLRPLSQLILRINNFNFF